MLLPSLITLNLDGPTDKPAMNIRVMVDPISLTLSPAIVRLIIHAVETLLPKEVCGCGLIRASEWNFQHWIRQSGGHGLKNIMTTPTCMLKDMYWTMKER